MIFLCISVLSGRVDERGMNASNGETACHDSRVAKPRDDYGIMRFGYIGKDEVVEDSVNRNEGGKK